MTQQVCRAVRLIELMRLLNERRWTIAELADYFDVAEVTIRRDLSTIQDAPLRYPIVTERVWGRMHVLMDC